MSALAFQDRTAATGRPRAAGRAFATGVALGAVVAMRWHIFQTAAIGGLTEGLIFGVLLVGVALLGGLRPTLPGPGTLAAGLAAGGTLVAASLAAHWPVAPLVLGHAAPFAPWVAVTTLVATGEELVLRGAFWHWLAEAGGEVTALLLTSALFALIHVPVYGLRVVPLDIGVGLWFGGLRLWFGGPAAPAAAHVLADLATWWL